MCPCGQATIGRVRTLSERTGAPLERAGEEERSHRAETSSRGLNSS
jgi:hypothetical protein